MRLTLFIPRPYRLTHKEIKKQRTRKPFYMNELCRHNIVNDWRVSSPLLGLGNFLKTSLLGSSLLKWPWKSGVCAAGPPRQEPKQAYWQFSHLQHSFYFAVRSLLPGSDPKMEGTVRNRHTKLFWSGLAWEVPCHTLSPSAVLAYPKAAEDRTFVVLALGLILNNLLQIMGARDGISWFLVNEVRKQSPL